jgi:orotidine-5'-phosphate decarboxylase
MNAEDRLLELADRAAADIPTTARGRKKWWSAEGVAAIELSKALQPRLVAAALRVVRAARAVQSGGVAPNAETMDVLVRAVDAFDAADRDRAV